MKKAGKILSLLLCVATVFLMYGCDTKNGVTKLISDSGKTEVDPGIDEIGYTIPYIRSDSLNPYLSVEQLNQSISTLIYDSLFSVDNSFKAQPLIAQSYTQAENKITVKLKSVKFTDGTAVTPDDVVYSFILAKKCDSYKPYLKNIADCSADGAVNVVFTLKNANPFETANLFFPILKKGSEDEKSSDDYSAKLPVGSGRYTLSDDGKTNYLSVNKARLGGYHPKYNKIGLKDVADTAAIPNLFSFGEVDFYTESFTDGKAVRYTGNAATRETSALTFIGINSDRKIFSDSKVRRAIALLLDRKDLAAVAFAGFARETSTPFNPNFYGLNGCTLPPIKYDKNAAKELLDEAGFNKFNGDGIRYSESGTLRIRLLVNKENAFRLALARSVQQALEKADIDVTLKEYSYRNYVSAVENGEYDIYIGEAIISNGFNLNSFFSESGSLSFGINSEFECIDKYRDFMSGKAEMQEFLDDFSDELPFIPIAYRQSITVRSDKIKTDSKTTVSDFYSNVNEWAVK